MTGAASDTAPRSIAGARYAFQVVHPAAPMLRVRYRHGIAVDPYGFPDWIPYARVLVNLPPRDAGWSADATRVLDVLTANEAVAAVDAGHAVIGGDRDGTAVATPAGWVWAHLAELPGPRGSPGRTSRPAGPRRVALVPAELHAAHRHLGGVSVGTPDRARRGVPVDATDPPRIRFTERLSAAAVRAVERRLGVALPPAYRDFLARTNGGRPAWPAVHPAFGFVVDQPFFGTARRDWLQDLAYANAWFGDRLTQDWLAVGYVQGGLLTVRVRGADEGSVWYHDDDDPRDTDAFTAVDVCDRLLHRCADDFAAFWRSLRRPPSTMLEQARAAVRDGTAAVVTDPRQGTTLTRVRPSRTTDSY